MSFYHDSSSLGRVGGKSYSPAEKKRRREFYYDALLHAPYPSASQAIQPYYFGDAFSKYTLLWLHNLPGLMATCICEDFVSWTSIHRSARIRSQTFPGIASAMAAQWGCFV